MFVAEPEVTPDRTEAVLVLLPVAVEAGQADLASLNDGPSAAVVFHVTEDLKQSKNVKVKSLHTSHLSSVYESDLRLIRAFPESHLLVVCTLRRFCSFYCIGMHSHRLHLREKKI